MNTTLTFFINFCACAVLWTTLTDGASQEEEAAGKLQYSVTKIKEILKIPDLIVVEDLTERRPDKQVEQSNQYQQLPVCSVGQ